MDIDLRSLCVFHECREDPPPLAQLRCSSNAGRAKKGSVLRKCPIVHYLGLFAHRVVIVVFS